MISELTFAGISGATAAGLAIAAGVILTGLYLLKLQRRRVMVPFAPLWAPAGGERRSERLARRLRRWLSLLLQLIFAGLVLLAAADPRPMTGDRAGRSVLILVDRSASMSATDGAPDGTRLAQARRSARALATGLGAADRAMVASFGAGVTAESGFDTDAARLGAAVDRIAASEEPADLGRALTFAVAVLRDRPHPTLIIVSDGAFSADDRRGADPLAGIDVRFAPVGRRGDNLALLSFAARRYPADPSSVEAAVVVQSFRDRASDVVLEITAGADARPVDRVRLHLQPHQRQRHLLPDVAAPDALLQARLIDTGDDLAVDDRAFAVVPGLAHWKILRVGDPNLFLEGALLSLGAGVEVSHRAGKDLEATRASWSRYDVVIFDGVTPSPAPSAGHYVYLDPQGAASPFPDRGVLREPVITDVHKDHPLLRHFSLTDVNIGEARRLALGPGDEAIASSLGAPLILTRSRPDPEAPHRALRVVALAFDIRRSDLPMRAAFPLLLTNGFRWLGAPETAEPARLRTGHTLQLSLPAGRLEAAVTDPSGTTRVVPGQAGVVEIPIARTGFYRVATTTLAANLADEIESNTAPASTLVLGGRPLPPPDAPAHGRRHDLWWWALLAAVALVLGEWWSYHRRWTV
jgi:hypothetical protein